MPGSRPPPAPFFVLSTESDIGCMYSSYSTSPIVTCIVLLDVLNRFNSRVLDPWGGAN